MIKRFLSIVLAMLMLLSCLPVQAEAADMTLYINGEEAAFADAQGNKLDIVLHEGRLYAPVIAMGQELGLAIDADPIKLTVTMAGKRMNLVSGGVTLKPIAMGGVVYVPVLAFANALDDCSAEIRGTSYLIGVEGALEYKQGLAALKNGEYAKARSLLKQAGKYNDAAVRISEAWYKEAEDLLKQEKYADASAAFKNAGNYNDAPGRVGEPWYAAAEALLKQEEYADASAAFKKAGNYNDAAGRVSEPFYIQGQKLQAEGKQIEAATAYVQAGKYKDAPELASQMLDDAAGSMITSGDYKGAYAIYGKVGKTNNESIKMMFYKMAQTKEAAGQTESAKACYELAWDYADAKAKYQALCYADAAALETAGKTEDAIEAYKAIGDYQDAQDKWKKLVYNKAKQLQTNQKFDEAYKLFDTIRGYSDVDNRLSTNAGLKKAAQKLENTARINAVKVGDVFTYGNYIPVDSTVTTKQPIEWKVLKKDDGKVLVLSQYALAKRAFHTSNTKTINWSTSALRTWLNGSFMNSAFTQAERGAVVSTSITSRLANSKTINSTDKVFLLSQNEYQTYLKDDKVTKNKRGNKVYAWTRDRYTSSYYVSYVSSSGTNGYTSMKTEYYIRPAMWLNLESTSVDWSKYIKTTAAATNQYTAIKQLMSKGNYADALSKLGKETASTEVTELTRECRYQLGLQAVRDGDLTTANQYFAPLDRFNYKHTKEIKEIIRSIN
nr:tetratricopeptide repeat protein [Clostridia bacterium]